MGFGVLLVRCLPPGRTQPRLAFLPRSDQGVICSPGKVAGPCRGIVSYHSGERSPLPLQTWPSVTIPVGRRFPAFTGAAVPCWMHAVSRQAAESD